MPDDRFHHGNLRSALLVEAEQTLRSDGLEALSLRDLARRTGVSHGAPRRHFADRQALLDALAEQGFDRLAARMQAALHDDAPFEVQFTSVARAFVEFAIADAALLDLMFTTKGERPPDSLVRATERFYVISSEVVRRGHRAGRLTLPDPQRMQMLLIATLQGIATLVASGRLSADLLDGLLDDTAVLFVRRGGKDGGTREDPLP